MQVTYMNGAGNDFMVMDARGQQPDFAKLAVELCKLTHADGFMAVDDSEKADFRLHFYNADGSRGEMCGNGARCICRYAYDHGIAGKTMVVETDAGLVPGERLDENTYRVQLNNPGVPHAVAAYKGDLWADADSLREEMRALRFDPAFPKGANVNYYQPLEPGVVRILTFERGVEDFTLACGTGGGSVACVLWLEGKLPESTLTAHSRGGTLKYTVSGGNGVVTSLLLEGPTEVVRTYEI